MNKPAQQSHEVWYACLKAGTAAIRSPYCISRFPERPLPCLIVYHLPSFRDCFSWSLLKQADAFKLRTVTWRQGLDARRLSDPLEGVRLGLLPEPTLEERVEAVDAGWCTSQLQRLGKIRLSPFLPESGICVDGESFGVHMTFGIRLEWCCSGPSDWQELVTWTRAFIAGLPTPGVADDAPNGGTAKRLGNSTVGGEPSS